MRSPILVLCDVDNLKITLNKAQAYANQFFWKLFPMRQKILSGFLVGGLLFPQGSPSGYSIMSFVGSENADRSRAMAGKFEPSFEF
jgi:hypothetical protein